MLGDIIIFIKNWMKENIFCRHKYIYKEINPYTAYWVCEKCGRVKKFNNKHCP